MALLEVDALSVSYGEAPALTALTFNLGAGQRFGIVGAAGAGKSTLALALGGLLPPGARTEGGIRFAGSALPRHETGMARLRGQRIGLLFGDGRAALDPFQPIAAPAALLGELGLRPHSYPHELDAAEQRLALLALALAREPELLVADAPEAGLDPVGARRVLDAIGRLQQRLGIALLLLSRDHRAVALCCNEAMVLRAGRSIELGPPASLFGRPQHEHTRALVAAARLRPRTLTRSPIGTELMTLRDVQLPLPRGGKATLGFAIRRGEALAIVAPPQSGKTRLARIIAGLDRAVAGIIVLDHDHYHGDDLPAARRGEISAILARPETSFDPLLPVGNALSQPLRLGPHRTIEEQADRLVEVVRDVGLTPDLLGALPGTLEREQLYRFAIARALISRPKLVIVDEPAAGFDFTRRNVLVELIDRVRSDHSLTLLVATGDLDIARALADRALVLADGIVEEGHPADLIEAPVHAVTRALAAARLPEVAAPSGGA
jgi:peptide/nickel transport system ATP-binding protein